MRLCIRSGFVLALVFAAAAPVHAAPQQQSAEGALSIVRDPWRLVADMFDGKGRYVGSTRRGANGSRDTYDGQGRYAGSSRPGPNRSNEHYDASGRYAGTSIRKSDGTIERYDAAGRYVGSTRP